MKFLGEYSNSWGHLAMSLAVIVFAGVLLVLNVNTTVTSLAIAVVTLLVGYWFGSGIIAAHPPVIVTTPAPITITAPAPIVVTPPAPPAPPA